jgi:hypothetical protein
MGGDEERVRHPRAELASVVSIHPVEVTADDLGVLARELTRAAFGAAAVAADLVIATLTSVAAKSGQSAGSVPRESTGSAAEATDAIIGVAWSAVRLGDAAAQRAASAARPLVRMALSPPLVPERLRPMNLLATPTRRWRADREGAIETLALWSSALAPAAGERAARLVDLDAIMVGAIGRIHLQELAETAISRLDLDALASSLIAEIDVRTLADQLVASVDLTSVVRSAMESMDLAALVADALDQVDLTGIVVERVDFERVIVRAMESIDLTQLVLDRVDLVRLVDGVDLPEIIRESTGSMATETLEDVRIQSMAADQAIAKVMGRLLRRKPEPT